MILGLRTVIYPVADLALGTDWYARATGTRPYCAEPYYVGFNVGGFELGLIPDGAPGATGGLAYWGVPDAEAEVARFEAELGATVVEPVTDVGGGIRVAAVLDPFGNRVGLIENPHFDRDEVR
jgi:predicted enzyme related to lactoylglutathione lyase